MLWLNPNAIKNRIMCDIYYSFAYETHEILNFNKFLGETINKWWENIRDGPIGLEDLKTQRK